MGLTVTARDGHEFGAYRADPDGAVKGGIVVIQEIFGVNIHIRDVTDGFAQAGYAAIAPHIFDRVERGLELGYTGDDVARGRDTRAKLGFDDPILDIAACVEILKGEGLKVGTVGYCYGGALAWLSAARIDGLSAAVGYYGTAANFKDEAPKCPVLLHYGEKDQMIPHSDADLLKAMYRNVDAHVYPADHGFNCDRRGSYHKASADIALDRTLAFFGEHLT